MVIRLMVNLGGGMRSRHRRVFYGVCSSGRQKPVTVMRKRPGVVAAECGSVEWQRLGSESVVLPEGMWRIRVYAQHMCREMNQR